MSWRRSCLWGRARWWCCDRVAVGDERLLPGCARSRQAGPWPGAVEHADEGMVGRVIFQGELLDKVMAGEKTVTRRLCSDNRNSPWWVVKCAFAPGAIRSAQRGRSKTREANIRILGVERQTLATLIHGALPDVEREARLEGFSSLAVMADAWREINGDGSWVPALKVWRIEFELHELVAPASIAA